MYPIFSNKELIVINELNHYTRFDVVVDDQCTVRFVQYRFTDGGAFTKAFVTRYLESGAQQAQTINLEA